MLFRLAGRLIQNYCRGCARTLPRFFTTGLLNAFVKNYSCFVSFGLILVNY